MALPIVLLLVPLAWAIGTAAFVAVASMLAAIPWPMSRAPVFAGEITDPELRATYAAILERIRAQGYDPARLVPVPQPVG